MPADARLVAEVQRVLPPDWADRPLLFLQLHDPTWTWARWDQAQVALAQWRLLQARANACRGVAPLREVWDTDERWEETEDAVEAG